MISRSKIFSCLGNVKLNREMIIHGQRPGIGKKGMRCSLFSKCPPIHTLVTPQMLEDNYKACTQFRIFSDDKSALTYAFQKMGSNPLSNTDPEFIASPKFTPFGFPIFHLKISEEQLQSEESKPNQSGWRMLPKDKVTLWSTIYYNDKIGEISKVRFPTLSKL